MRTSRITPKCRCGMFSRKNYISSFDIEIRDHKGHLYPRSAIADFVLVLMFETVEEMEYNKDDLVAYNAMAYRVGHPTSSGILG